MTPCSRSSDASLITHWKGCGATLLFSMRQDKDYSGSGGEEDDGYGWDGIAIIWCVGVDGLGGSAVSMVSWLRLNGGVLSKGRCYSMVR